MFHSLQRSTRASFIRFWTKKAEIAEIQWLEVPLPRMAPFVYHGTAGIYLRDSIKAASLNITNPIWIYPISWSRVIKIRFTEWFLHHMTFDPPPRTVLVNTEVHPRISELDRAARSAISWPGTHSNPLPQGPLVACGLTSCLTHLTCELDRQWDLVSLTLTYKHVVSKREKSLL